MADEVLLRIDGAVAWLTLSNPNVRNALTWKMYGQLASACVRIGGDSSIRVVVVRGAGEAFAAGTDIAQFTEFTSAEDGVRYERRIAEILRGIAGMDVPVIAAVDGPAVGGGLAIAAMCDVVIATPQAFFAVPIARTLGNCISAGMLARLHAGFGRSRALAMLLTASRIGAEDAREAGFVHAVVERSELDGHLHELARRVAGSAPLTLAAIKAADRLLAPDSAADEEILRSCYGSRDFREGVDAFVHRRRPQWEGR